MDDIDDKALVWDRIQRPDDDLADREVCEIVEVEQRKTMPLKINKIAAEIARFKSTMNSYKEFDSSIPRGCPRRQTVVTPDPLDLEYDNFSRQKLIDWEQNLKKAMMRLKEQKYKLEVVKTKYAKEREYYDNDEGDRPQTPDLLAFSNLQDCSEAIKEYGEDLKELRKKGRLKYELVDPEARKTSKDRRISWIQGDKGTSLYKDYTARFGPKPDDPSLRDHRPIKTPDPDRHCCDGDFKEILSAWRKSMGSILKVEAAKDQARSKEKARLAFKNTEAGIRASRLQHIEAVYDSDTYKKFKRLNVAALGERPITPVVDTFISNNEWFRRINDWKEKILDVEQKHRILMSVVRDDIAAFHDSQTFREYYLLRKDHDASMRPIRVNTPEPDDISSVDEWSETFGNWKMRVKEAVDLATAKRKLKDRKRSRPSESSSRSNSDRDYYPEESKFPRQASFQPHPCPPRPLKEIFKSEPDWQPLDNRNNMIVPKQEPLSSYSYSNDQSNSNQVLPQSTMSNSAVKQEHLPYQEQGIDLDLVRVMQNGRDILNYVQSKAGLYAERVDNKNGDCRRLLSSLVKKGSLEGKFVPCPFFNKDNSCDNPPAHLGTDFTNQIHACALCFFTLDGMINLHQLCNCPLLSHF